LTGLKIGLFDQRSFSDAFQIFSTQSIEESLVSDNLIIRIFAVPDRLVGKRCLLKMQETISEEPETFREFRAIRMAFENL